MKILRISVDGLPLFKGALDLRFYAQQRVAQEDRDELFHLGSNVYLTPTLAFAGINASGKTSALKVVDLALAVLRGKSIGSEKSASVLEGANTVIFEIWFAGEDGKLYLLESTIETKENPNLGKVHVFTGEVLYKRHLEGTRKSLFDKKSLSFEAAREENEYLSDDVSFIGGYCRKNKMSIEAESLLPFGDVNSFTYVKDIDPSIVHFLDSSIEYIRYEKINDRLVVRLKFVSKEEIVCSSAEAAHYLSSGTIKGIRDFHAALRAIQNGGYLLVDEIENHFNKEIAVSLMKIFMDGRINRKGAVLIFTTHYPELLDLYYRNDPIYIMRNDGGITAENLQDCLKRNDVKKSYAFKSGYLNGTAPSYEAFMLVSDKFEKASSPAEAD